MTVKNVFVTHESCWIVLLILQNVDVYGAVTGHLPVPYVGHVVESYLIFLALLRNLNVISLWNKPESIIVGVKRRAWRKHTYWLDVSVKLFYLSCRFLILVLCLRLKIGFGIEGALG